MIIEISVAVIAAAFVVLTVFLIKTLRTSEATLKQTKQTLSHMQKELADLSHESHKLIKNANDLTADLKNKSASLNFIFRPLSPHREKESDLPEKITGLLEWIASSVVLFKKLKEK